MSAHLLLAASLAASLAAALPSGDETALRQAPIPQLQAWYLACDQVSRREALDSGMAAPCSVVAEALLQRGFGGDFDRLLAWWRAQAPAPVATR